MAPVATSSFEVSSLIETATSTLALLRRFSSIPSDRNTPPANQITTPEPLDVLYDAAKLLKAHTTKLSLLVINKPFTPNAIRKIIAEVSGTCIPGLMGAVELCRPEKYGRLLNEEVRFRVRKVFREFEDMMEDIIAKAGNGRVEQSRKESLASTGVVWEACDGLMELKSIGMVGLVVRKAMEYKTMLEDALGELKEWGEDEVDDDEEEEDVNGEDAGSDDADSLEDILSAACRLPKGRTDLRETLDLSLKKLKLVSTLYQALIKRRLKTIETGAPAEDVSDLRISPEIASRVDGLLDILKSIPDQTDELASAFYDLENEEAKKGLGDVCDSGKQAIKLMRINWFGKEDEFSTWSDKWKEAVDG